MKKTAIYICFAIIVSLLFTACAPSVPAGQKAIELYFVTASRDSLASETGYISENDFKNTKTLVGAVMDKLLAGPSNPEYKSIIPDGVTLRGVSESKTDYGTVNIDLGGEFYKKLSDDSSLASDELLARYSIICTLCQFENIRKIKFYINGEDLRASGGKGDIVQPMGSDNVLVNSPSSVETQTEKFVTLYFTDKNGKKLYPETRKATMADSSLEKTIVTELIRGPVSEDLQRTLVPSAELVSIETTEEVCFVNLSAASMSKIESGSDEERVAVYSIVNSLTRVAGIEKVQILIDGKKPEKDVHQLFSTPLERNQSIINEADIS